MSEQETWDHHLAGLLREAALAPFALNGALVVWSADGTSILHADAAGRALLAESLAEAGLERLRSLALALAPSSGVRLEKLALIEDQPALTTACRMIEGPDGAKALLTLFRPPRQMTLGATPAVAEPAPAQPAQKPEPTPAPEAPAPELPRKGSVRFLWECDAEGAITRLSPEFAQAFGEEARQALIGRAFAALIGPEIIDQDGRLLPALASRQTWSGVSLHWRQTPVESVRVDLSALPVQDGARQVTGFRGFGLARLGQREPWPAGPVAAEPATPAPQQPVPSQADEDDIVLRDLPAQKPVTPRAPDLSDKVVQLRPQLQPPGDATPAATPDASVPALSPVEKQAFREIAKALGARIEGDEPEPPAATTPPVVPVAPVPEAPKADPEPPRLPPAAPLEIGARALQQSLPFELTGAGSGDVVFAELLDKLPIGVLVSRGERVIYANRTLIDLLDYDSLSDLAAPGLLDRLFRGGVPFDDNPSLVLNARGGDPIPVDARLSSIIWNGEAATLFAFRRAMQADATGRAQALALDVEALRARLSEQAAILDTATDGVVTLDERGRILSLNKSAEALFGYDQREVAGEPVTTLLAPESHGAALDYLEGLIGGGVASVLNDGREVIARERQGGRIPLFMTMGRISDSEERKFCAVLRDMTAWKKAEGDLTAARQAAEEASRQKSDLLAKISHEIRTPLNAIIGFSEMMGAESYGPLGSPKYKEYLQDIRESGSYVMSLVNDLLDLAKVEAGRLDLEFGSVSLNEVAQASVGLLQPEAARNRVLIRSSFTPKMPPVVADTRSLRQIVINLLSNAVKFTDPGGQIIISTALGDKGEAILRIRDTGIGMDQDELKLAMEPFRQVASATRKAKGTGLGLPLTKALVEANRGELLISSAKGEGTLVEVVFPPQRVLAG